MGWSNELTPGHDGYLLGLVPQRGSSVSKITVDAWRPLSGEDVEVLYLRVVQVGCTCGWRSPRMEAPIGACWQLDHVRASDWFLEDCRIIWRAHAIATVYADRERAIAR